MPALAIQLTVTALPGRRSTVLELWEGHLSSRVRDSAEQVLYLVVEDLDDLEVFHLTEVYTDENAADSNAHQPWFVEYMAAVGPLLAGPPSMRRGRPVWTKPSLL